MLSTYGDGDGVQLGTHPVTVSMPVSDEGQDPGRSAVRIPTRYSRAATSGLTITVEKGEVNSVELDLKSD